MSLVVFPFKDEDLTVVSANLGVAAHHDRVDEVWAVAAGKGRTLTAVAKQASEIADSAGIPVSVFPQRRLGSMRRGKGDGMNTAIALSAERGFERTHFYDADITNFDETWIDGAEAAADRGFGVVRHRFPRAATDAMITWMVTRPGLTLLFPGSLLPRLGQPLGGEILLTREVTEALAADTFVVARSDWGIDTVITHATAMLDTGIYEHYAADGKRHALYGALSEIREMLLECLDAVGSLAERPPPRAGLASDSPAPVPADLKTTVAYDVSATRSQIAAPPGPRERALLESLGLDPSQRIVMDGDRWHQVFPDLMERFVLGDRDWEAVAFRLWVERVIHYTENQVPLGYDAAMAYLEQRVGEFEGSP